MYYEFCRERKKRNLGYRKKQQRKIEYLKLHTQHILNQILFNLNQFPKDIVFSAFMHLINHLELSSKGNHQQDKITTYRKGKDLH